MTRIREFLRLVGCYCSYLLPNRKLEHPKLKSTQPRCSTTMVTLYYEYMLSLSLSLSLSPLLALSLSYKSACLGPSSRGTWRGNPCMTSGLRMGNGALKNSDGCFERISKASLSHLRTTLPESSSWPLPAKWPNHATLSLFYSKSLYLRATWLRSIYLYNFQSSHKHGPPKYRNYREMQRFIGNSENIR